MTDGDAWEAHCAAGEGPPFVCNECGWTCDPSDGGAAGYTANGECRKQYEIVEALLILGADITSDMQALRDRTLALEVSNA